MAVATIRTSPAETMRLSLMTYNVHSCLGRDGIVSPSRIASVVASLRPDVLALQEVDLGLSRTGHSDQSRVIAEILKMEYLFHPALHRETGQYGNAVMSRYPLRLVRGGKLPALPGRKAIEERGALWTEIRAGGVSVQVINTHLGLVRRERLAQAAALLGPEWLGHPDCRPPAILCGDMNDLPFSRVCRMFRTALRDAQLGQGRAGPKSGWPSRFPFTRLDYVFTSPGIVVADTRVPRTPPVRAASDHLPLFVELEVRSPAGTPSGSPHPERPD